MVQGDFPIKLGQKTLKNPWSISLKTLSHLKVTILKYNWKSIFDFLLNIDRNSLKKIRIEILTFSFHICFRNQFWTRESGQTENTQIRVFSYFPFDHFLKSKFYSKSRFEMRILEL